MKLVTAFFFITLYASLQAALIDPRNLRCLVCQTTFAELDKVIMAVDRKKLVEVGNFRMDASGNTMQHRVPAHRSDIYISEVVEKICEKLKDYVRVVYKSTGKLAIMPMELNGHMNPEFSKTTFITDDDLNKSLEYYCERIFEENDEEILSEYKNRPEDDVMPDALHNICFKHAGYCDDWMLINETDTTWTAEMEEAYVKIHGPDPYGFGMNIPPPPPQDSGDHGQDLGVEESDAPPSEDWKETPEDAVDMSSEHWDEEENRWVKTEL